MAFLIDLTDERFKIPANRAVIEYIRRENPFAHSDVGALLIAFGKRVPGTQYYCPSFSSPAYVVLHTPANVIFAIAIGMRKVDFRLPFELVTEALESGEAEHSAIGQRRRGVSLALVPAVPQGRIESLNRDQAQNDGAKQPTSVHRNRPAPRDPSKAPAVPSFAETGSSRGYDAARKAMPPPARCPSRTPRAAPSHSA